MREYEKANDREKEKNARVSGKERNKSKQKWSLHCMQPTSDVAFVKSMSFNETQMLHNNRQKQTA